MTLQQKYNELANKTDKQMMRRFEEKYDTRAAALIENITYQGTLFLFVHMYMYYKYIICIAGAKAIKHISQLQNGEDSPPPASSQPRKQGAGAEVSSPAKVGERAQRMLAGLKVEHLLFGASGKEGGDGMLGKCS